MPRGNVAPATQARSPRPRPRPAGGRQAEQQHQDRREVEPVRPPQPGVLGHAVAAAYREQVAQHARDESCAVPDDVEQRVTITAARPSHLDSFLQTGLRRSRRQHGRAPRSAGGWPTRYTAFIHLLLRMAQGIWPPPTPASNPRERFCRPLREGYRRWLVEVRGLSTEMLRKEAIPPRASSRGSASESGSRRRRAGRNPTCRSWRRSETRCSTTCGTSGRRASIVRFSCGSASRTGPSPGARPSIP